MNKNIAGSDYQIVLSGDPTTGLPLAPGGIQAALLTDGGGAAQRVKVDIAQTSFFQGRMFRYFTRLNIPLGSTQVIRIESPVNYVLYSNNATVKSGELDISVRVGCTESGTYSTTITPRKVNGMTTAAATTSTMLVTTGGGIVANSGTEISAFQASAASGFISTSSTVGNSQSDEIGVAAGSVVYLVMTSINSGVGAAAVVGVHNYRWEERP